MFFLDNIFSFVLSSTITVCYFSDFTRLLFRNLSNFYVFPSFFFAKLNDLSGFMVRYVLSVLHRRTQHCSNDSFPSYFHFSLICAFFHVENVDSRLFANTFALISAFNNHSSCSAAADILLVDNDCIYTTW